MVSRRIKRFTYCCMRCFLTNHKRSGAPIESNVLFLIYHLRFWGYHIGVSTCKSNNQDVGVWLVHLWESLYLWKYNLGAYDYSTQYQDRWISIEIEISTNLVILIFHLCNLFTTFYGCESGHWMMQIRDKDGLYFSWAVCVREWDSGNCSMLLVEEWNEWVETSIFSVGLWSRSEFLLSEERRPPSGTTSLS